MAEAEENKKTKNDKQEVKVPDLPKKKGGKFFRILKKPLSFLRKILSSGIKSISSILFIFLIFYVLGGFLGPSGAGPNFREVTIRGEGINKILVVPLNGIVLNSPQPFSGFSGSITPQGVQEVFKYASDKEDIKAVILEIESPGGSAVASDRVFDIISTFQKETKKPVVSLLGDTAASGGYYIASVGDQIVANPSTITGSIGVIASTFNVEELMEKLGVKERVFKKGQYKDILSGTREITEEEEEIIDSILNDAYEQFLDRITQKRDFSPSQLNSIASARIFSGVQALDIGLVDRLGNLDEAVEEAQKAGNIKDIKVVRLETGDILGQLFSGLSLGLLSKIISPDTQPRVWYLMQ